jgi:hypothetical protein
LEYAVLDDSVGFSGRTLLFVDGKELGPAPCLAICQKLKATEVLLFHCDSDWTVLGAGFYAAVSEAKKRAERIYPGISPCWIDAQVTEDAAVRWLDEMWGDRRCGFCGRRPDEVAQIFGRGAVHICDTCVTEFHKALQESPGGAGKG